MAQAGMPDALIAKAFFARVQDRASRSAAAALSLEGEKGPSVPSSGSRVLDALQCLVPRLPRSAVDRIGSFVQLKGFDLIGRQVMLHAPQIDPSALEELYSYAPAWYYVKTRAELDGEEETGEEAREARAYAL